MFFKVQFVSVSVNRIQKPGLKKYCWTGEEIDLIPILYPNANWMLYYIIQEYLIKGLMEFRKKTMSVASQQYKLFGWIG